MRFFLKYLGTPIVVYVVGVIVGMLIVQSDTNHPLYGLVPGYLICFPPLTVLWWVISFARWLYNEHDWITIPYLIVNLATGFVIAVLGFFGAALLINNSNAISIPFLGGILGGIVWFGHSLYVWIMNSSWDYDSIHILPLEFEFPSMPFISRQEKPVEPVVSETQEPKRKSNSSIFRSIQPFSSEQAETSGAVPIPPRGSSSTRKRKTSTQRIKPQEVYRPQFEYRFSISTPSASFVSEARKYVNRTEGQTEPVPFMQYWPTYSSMSRAQQKWYFYWRTQLRQGVRLPADTSYLFVYIYEVINLVGFDTPRQAFDHLVKFWGYYRKLQPKLDNYLPDWIADFIVVHKLPTVPLKWYGRIAKLGVLGDEDLLIEAWLHAGSDYDLLSNEVLFRLADYNPTKSKFYKGQSDQAALDQAYKKGLEAVDTHVKQETGKSLFAMHQSERTRVIRRLPFAGAVNDYAGDEIEIAAVHAWYGNQALSDSLKNVVKYTENVIREQYGYRYKLRDIDLDATWGATIEAAFKLEAPKREVKIDLSQISHLKEESKAVRDRLILDEERELTKPNGVIPTVAEQNTNQKVADEPQKARVEINLEKINQLRTDSDALRDKLIIEDEWLEPVEERPLGEQEVATIPVYLVRPAHTADGLLTDLIEVAAILGKRSSTTFKVIALLHANDWQCSSDAVQQELENEFANVVIDQINETAMDEIGDALLYQEDGQWIVLEEYRDEIQHILDHPDTHEEIVAEQSPAQLYAELDEEWADFVHCMKPQHWDALAAILHGEDVVNRIDTIARRYHQTGNILIDEMNEFAYSSIGDLLIDTAEAPPSIVEDVYTNTTDLLNWAVSHQIIEV